MNRREIVSPRTKVRGLKRDDFLTPPIVTQEGRAFCAEGLCPSCINRLESHSRGKATTFPAHEIKKLLGFQRRNKVNFFISCVPEKSLFFCRHPHLKRRGFLAYLM